MNQSFWNGRRVLITGHTGFKGSWLSLWLHHLGAKVIGVALDPPTSPSLYEQANVTTGILSLRQDIRNGQGINELFKKYQPEIVFHLAAQPLVRYSYYEPVETYETNVMGTLNVLEGIRSVESVCAAIMVTTDKCYENREWLWGYRENEPMGGHDPYSSSKGAAELLIASYRNSYYSQSCFEHHKTAIATVRAGNVIGGGDWASDRLIPDIIKAFKKNKPLEVRSPNAIRPWQHVLEPLSGYLQLAEALTDKGYEYAEAWNFGPREEGVQTVQWIVEKMAEQWGSRTSWVLDENETPHEANYLKLDCSKAHTRLNWQPKWSLSQALKKIVEWHKVESDGGDCKGTCLAQIDEYMKG